MLFLSDVKICAFHIYFHGIITYVAMTHVPLILRL